MKQEQYTYRFGEDHNQWLVEQAKKKHCSKNDILRMLIAEKIEEKTHANSKINNTA